MEVAKRHSSSTAGLGLVHNTRTGDPWAGQVKYSKGVVATISIVLLIAALSSLYSRFTRYRRQKNADVRTAKSFSAGLSRFTAVLRLIKYRQLPSYRLGCINFRLPALGVTLLMCLLMLGFTLWAFVVQPYYRDARSFGSPPLALRSGMMALGLMPFIYVLGSKVNFISLITGTSHERLQVYHQWMARFMLFLSTVHAIPFIYQPLADDGAEGLHEEFYSDSINTTGVIAYACLFILSFASLSGIRERSYELFLLIHVPVAIIFLGYMFVHCQNLLTSWRYLWATAAMYMLSVFLRFAGQLSKNSFLSLSKCQIEALDEQMTRMTIQSPIRWQPGQHVFMRFPGLAPWSAHPFTIVSLPSTDSHQLMSTIVLMAKAQDGLTKRLHQLAKRASTSTSSREKESGTSSLYAIVDGPYGQDAEVSSYSQVLFIAGGSGITFVLASLLQLSWLWQQDKTGKRQVRLVWSIRDSGSLSWAQPHLQTIEALAPPDSFKISLFLSGKTAHTNDVCVPTSWEVRYGVHPDIGATVADFVRADSTDDLEKATKRLSSSDAGLSTAVVACGPSGMAEDASNAVASVQAEILRGRLPHLGEVRLVTEHFTS